MQLDRLVPHKVPLNLRICEKSGLRYHIVALALIYRVIFPCYSYRFIALFYVSKGLSISIPCKLESD
ncbi:hypothetical protein CPB86DRAFT_791283 [Serendipita vermifera]|nr:hypothetical protein CPB86DRAFT_791283 [Serendipita vermifera]